MTDPDSPEVVYWEYDDDDFDDGVYRDGTDDDDPTFLGPTPFPLPLRLSTWFRKNSYKGAHRW